MNSVLKKIVSGFLACAVPVTLLFSQSVPVPAAPQPGPILLTNAILHTGDGSPAFRGDLLFSEGKILAVGAADIRPAGTRVIDLGGKHIYPGIVALNTTLGLNEIEAVRSTRDAAETGEYNSNARAIIAYNTDSRVTPTVRSNGILYAEVVPHGGTVSGRSALVQLDAWNWEDAAVISEAAMHLNWPEMGINDQLKDPSPEEQEKAIEKSINAINAFFDEARSYMHAWQQGSLKEKDLRLEAMIPVLQKKMPLYIHASTEKQLISALNFLRIQNVAGVIVGAKDAWLLTRLLREQQVPVVLEKIHSLPRHEDDPVDISFRLPVMLMDSGVTVALSAGGFWDQRNLPFLAGTAASRGLDKEAALMAITLTPARLLGAEKRIGSLAKGKDASFIITSGDLFEMKESKVLQAFIAGREIDLGNQQADLYHKFHDKP